MKTPKKVVDRLVAVSLIMLLAALPVSAQEAAVDETPDEESSGDEVIDTGADDSYIPGIIFNTSNILLDLEAYQAGVGMMLLKENHSLRGNLGFSYESSNEALGSSLGLYFLKPIIKSRVTPYWGGGFNFGYDYDRDSFAADDWLITHEITMGISGVLGVEIFLMPFLSFFAEYQLGASIAWAKVNQNNAGVETSSTSFNYNFGTGLGNGGSIGITIYFDENAREKAKRGSSKTE